MAHDSQVLTVHRSIAAENLHTLGFCIYVVCTTEHAELQFDHLSKTPWDLYHFQKAKSCVANFICVKTARCLHGRNVRFPSAIFSSGTLEVMCNRLCRLILFDIGVRNRSANSFRLIKPCVITVNCKAQTCPFALFVMFVTGYLSTL